MRLVAVTSAFLAALVLAFSTACGSDSNAPNAHAELFARLWADTSPTNASSRPDGFLGEVKAARVTGDGASLVVLDRFEPFIHVLEPNGRRIRSFGKKGGGPGELSRPYALAVLGDSVIGAVSANGLTEYTLGGSFLGSAPLPHPYVLGISGYCERQWALFGPGTVSRRSAAAVDNEWLRLIPRVTAGDQIGTSTVLYRDSLVPAVYSSPRVTPIASAKERLVFIQTYSSAPGIVEGSCRTGDFVRSEYSLEYAGPDRRELGPQGPDGSRAMVVRLAHGPSHAGIGLTSRGVLVARRERARAAPTILTLLADGVVPRDISLGEGTWFLQDARPGVGAVLSTDTPWPRVVFIPEGLLLQAFAAR